MIQAVQNNKENNYPTKLIWQTLLKKNPWAFIFESIWILYAMAEDRTSAFLYHIGFTQANNHSSVTGLKIIKKDIRTILELEDNSNDKYNFDKISGKIHRMERVILWSDNTQAELSPYQDA